MRRASGVAGHTGLAREFQPDFWQAGRDWMSNGGGALESASARIETPDERVFLARFIRNHHQTLCLHRRLWSAIGNIDCEGTRNRGATLGKAGNHIETRDEIAFLTRAIRDGYHRIRFQRELVAAFEKLGRDGVRKDLMLFATAVSHLENAAKPDNHLADFDAHPLDNPRLGAPSDDDCGNRNGVKRIPPPRTRRALVSQPQKRHESVVLDLSDRPSDVQPESCRRIPAWPIVLMVAGALATAVYAKDRLIRAADTVWQVARLFTDSSSPAAAAWDARLRPEPHGLSLQAASRLPVPATRPASPLLLPDSYGLYAVSDGQLTRLRPLRMSVPNARIANAGLITKPSPVVVPNGHLSFIAYQRELRTNAPDHASMRIIAKVSRVLKFAATGKATTTNLKDTWAVRPVSIDLLVAPVPDNQEMLLIRASAPELSLSAGRYMLIFKNQAYDFAIHGATTDSAHCLQRTETQNGAVYTECREPEGPA